MSARIDALFQGIFHPRSRAADLLDSALAAYQPAGGSTNVDAAAPGPRTDGIYNTLTGVGNALRDKTATENMAIKPFRPLTVEECEQLFLIPLARRVITLLPEQAYRKGFGLDAVDEKKLDAVDGAAKIARAAWTARLYGGAVWLRGGPGGEDTQLPDGATVPQLSVVERPYMQPSYSSGIAGKPSAYTITAADDDVLQNATAVHASRLVFFPGALTTLRMRRANSWWDHSILDVVLQSLVRAEMTDAAMNAIAQDFSLIVMHLQGLSEAAATKSTGDAFLSRVQLATMLRSVTGTVTLDAGGGPDEDPKEEISVVERSLTGVPDLWRQRLVQLAADVGIPVTVLLGQSPTALGTTGETDKDTWNSVVTGYRQATEKAIRRVLSAILGKAQDAIAWPPLDEPTELEVWETESARAGAYKAWIDAAVIQPEQAALAAFTDEDNVLGIEIDEAALRESMAVAAEARTAAMESLTTPAEGTDDETDPASTPPPSDGAPPAEGAPDAPDPSGQEGGDDAQPGRDRRPAKP